MWDKKYKRQQKYYQNNRRKCRDASKKWQKNNQTRVEKTHKKWLENNKKRRIKWSKEYRQNNKEKIKEYDKKYRQENKERIKAQGKKWRENNIERMKEYRKRYKKIYSERYKKSLLKRQKTFRKRHPERVRETNRKWRKDNIEKVREYCRKGARKRLSTPRGKLDNNIAKVIRVVLKGRKARRSWEELVKYTIEDLVKHLENLFDENMTWDNYGSYWEIDHKIPKSWFKYTTAEDPKFQECWALKNLQPLEKELNRSKGNRFKH